MGKRKAVWQVEHRRTMPWGEELRAEQSDGGSFRYFLTDAERGRQLASVTSVVDAMWRRRSGAFSLAQALADRLCEAGLIEPAAIQDHLAALPSSRGADRFGEVAHRWIADCISGTCALGDVPPEHAPIAGAATHFYGTLVAGGDREPLVEELVCNPDLGYAGRVDLICETPAGAALVEFKTTPTSTVGFTSNTLLAAAAFQLEMLRQASLASGHDIVSSHLVVISRTGSYSKIGGFVDPEAVPPALAAYRKRVHVGTVSSSSRVKKEIRDSLVGPGAIASLLTSENAADDEEFLDEDLDGDGPDLYEELFGEGSRDALLRELAVDELFEDRD